MTQINNKNEVYIAGSISRTCEREWHSKISKKLEEFGAKTYAPGDNDSINDKTNNPTPVDIHEADVDRLFSCEIFLCELHGGKQDGTIWECGWVSAWNAMVTRLNLDLPLKKMYFYTSNSRLLNNAYHNMGKITIPSESLNHLVLGGFEIYGSFLGNTEDMLEFMEELLKDG